MIQKVKILNYNGRKPLKLTFLSEQLFLNDLICSIVIEKNHFQ